MKQISIKDGKVVVEEVPDPILGSNEVLVANMFSAISTGTEKSVILESRKGKFEKIFELLKKEESRRKAIEYIKSFGLMKAYQSWRQAFSTFGKGVSLGYSSVGVVLSVGKGVIDIAVGDHVACAGFGYANHAELVAVPRNLVVKVPNCIELPVASFVTIGSIALHALRLAEIQPGEYVAIIGSGLIGLITIQLAKNVFNAKVIAVDVNADRVELAKCLGADKAIMLTKVGKADVINEIMEWTNNLGVDASVITAATKSGFPLNFGLEILRSRGRVVVVGDVKIDVDRELMYRKEASLIVSRSYGPGRYDPLYEVKGLDYPIEYVRWTLNRNMQAFLEFVRDGKVQLRPLITKVVKLEEAPKVYEEIVEGKSNYIGVVISYDYEKYLNKQLKHTIKFSKEIPQTSSGATVKSGKIRLGIIGAGSFVNNVLLPILLKDLSSFYEIVAVSTKHPHTCKEAALKSKASYCTTDYAEILEDDDINAVIISTPHNTHAKLVIECLKAGKAIFVEKPLTLNEEELTEIQEIYKRNPNPITVDFNRRFSPFTYELRKITHKETPIYGIYRVNAGFIPLNHWIQDPEIGGGRIIGEVCHFVDFFNAIIGEKADELFVNSIPVNNKNVIAKDNVSATITWHNGSLTTIHYTSTGSPLLPKEYIELHTGQKTVTIEDFQKMDIFLKNKKKTVRLTKQDKGHKKHLIEFAKIVRGEKSDIPPFEEYIYSMKLTFEIEKQLRGISEH